MKILIVVVIVVIALLLLSRMSRPSQGSGPSVPTVREPSANESPTVGPPPDVAATQTDTSPLPPDPPPEDEPVTEAEEEVQARRLDASAGWDETPPLIRADPESGTYHTPESPDYDDASDGQTFDTEEDAQAAGFTRWDESR
jgi:hypothetical protein